MSILLNKVALGGKACLKNYKKKLKPFYPPIFKRVSKNTILNMHKITEVQIEKRQAVLKNGEIYQVSVRKMKEIVQLLETLN